jgi:glycosyltransferase involved in cell wall biosynthesis
VSDLEIIVVVDGNDHETVGSLTSIGDSRLSIIEQERSLGQSEAKNIGAAAATARWVAFLDDDDEWLPKKLELQLRTAQASPSRYPIVACSILARDEVSEFHWPRRRPAPGEELSEYLFCPRLPFTGEGMVINSALLTSRELLARVPFRGRLWDDPDWLLRAVKEPDASLEFVAETKPLLIWHVERNRQRITNQAGWRDSLEFARLRHDLFTCRAYAGFLLHVVGSRAAAHREFGAFGLLLSEAFTRGRPSCVDLLGFFGNFLIPTSSQRWLARQFARWFNPSDSQELKLPVVG